MSRQTRTDGPGVARWLVALAAAAVTAGCAATKPAGDKIQDRCKGSVNHNLEIQFDGDGCPVSVTVIGGDICNDPQDTDTLCTKRNKTIRWRAKRGTDDFAVKYDLFFDPFRGRTVTSNDNGCARANIDPDAPLAVYKYSIVRRGPGCGPLDPRVIVQP